MMKNLNLNMFLKPLHLTGNFIRRAYFSIKVPVTALVPVKSFSTSICFNNDNNSINGDIGEVNNLLPEMDDSEFLDWLRGFTDGEGTFGIETSSVSTNGEAKSFVFRFSIGLHKDDLPVLYFIQKRLGFGKVYVYGDTARITMTSKEDTEKIIQIFNSTQLNTTKHLNFLDWKKALDLYYNLKSIPKFQNEDKEKAKKLIFDEILQLKNNMNTQRTQFDFPLNHKINITPYWLLGFVEAEGSFFLQKGKDSLTLKFYIGQNINDENVMLAIQEFLLSLTEVNKQNLKTQPVYFYLDKRLKFVNKKALVSVGTINPEYIQSVLIPFFDNLVFLTKKHLDYLDWKVIHDLKKRGWHYSDIGKEVILAIADRMNNGRLSTNISSKALFDNSSLTQREELAVHSKEARFELDKQINLLLDQTNIEIHDNGKVWIKSSQKYLSGMKIKINCFNEEGQMVNQFDSLKEAALYFNISSRTLYNKLEKGGSLVFNSKTYTLSRVPFLT